jgi:hypothetical protein
MLIIARRNEDLQKAVDVMCDSDYSDDSPLSIEIKPYKRNRSVLANAFLWGWVYDQIATKLGDAGLVIHCDDGTEHPYTAEILHEIFKQKFLAIGSIEAKGRSLTLYKSTTKLTKPEFSEFIEDVRGFVYQFWEITVQDPREGYWETILQELK